jgi:hypothetical protein
MHSLGKNRLSSVPELSHTASASPSNSIAASETASANGERPTKHDTQGAWRVFFPTISTAITTWAMNAKAQVRQQATSCCIGDLCGAGDGETVPDEIVIRTDSVVGEKATDIELMPVSTFDDPHLGNVEPKNRMDQEPWSLPLQIRRTTRWNDIPDDPVDEISLKGSSSYCSSAGDDERKLPIATELCMRR